MSYLIAAVVVVGVLCVLNLLLTYGVIRRLREHNELLAHRGQLAVPDLVVGAGSLVGPFSAATVDGDELIADDLVPGTLVGFFSPDCPACDEQLPKFADVAAAHPGGPERVLAVMIAPGEVAAEQVAALSSRARLVVVPPGAEIEKAFGVKGYPAFALLGEDRVVTASGMLNAVVGATAEAVA
jgi:thiol-disulfide isomerase/thioredoxin